MTSTPQDPAGRAAGDDRRLGAPGRAALDVLLSDAAVGNPAARALRDPVHVARGLSRVVADPRRLGRRAAGFGGELTRIARGTSELAPRAGDRRFADPAWERSWFFRRLLQGYLAAGELASQVVDDADLDWRTDTTARFLVENVHDMLAPTNFAWSNPAVIKETLDRGGANLIKGMRRAGRDVAARRLPAMVDASRFEVGGNVAATPGTVVLRTEVFELLEYHPTTQTVFETPLLVVPPTINKYYALDLAPGRSVVEHLVAAGHRVFMVSWCNPTEAESHFDLDVYASAVLQSRTAVSRIARHPSVNLVAACSGGIITSCALGHLAAEGRLDEDVASLTLLVCALDNERSGTASALARREVAAVAVAESARRGYVDGRALNNVFAWLRPNDLVWGYVINNYLMGKAPPAFDILFWNQDAVRLSAGLHRDFVRIALEDELRRPGALEVLGTPVDLGDVAVDTYAVAGLNDHIVPWQNSYRGVGLLGGDVRFVLSTSGHIQALINPPGPRSRSSYRAVSSTGMEEEDLLASTSTVPGSWWPDHVRWLGERSGERVTASSKPGNRRFRPLGPAPGTYVHVA